MQEHAALDVTVKHSRRVRVQVDKDGTVFVQGAKEVRSFFQYELARDGESLFSTDFNPSDENRRPYFWITNRDEGFGSIKIELKDANGPDQIPVLPHTNPVAISALSLSPHVDHNPLDVPAYLAFAQCNDQNVQLAAIPLEEFRHEQPAIA